LRKVKSDHQAAISLFTTAQYYRGNRKVSTKGQFVIPKQHSETHNPGVGTEFDFSFVGNETRRTHLPMLPRTSIANAAGLLGRQRLNRLSEKKSGTSISYQKACSRR